MIVQAASRMLVGQRGIVSFPLKPLIAGSNATLRVAESPARSTNSPGPISIAPRRAAYYEKEGSDRAFIIFFGSLNGSFRLLRDSIVLGSRISGGGRCLLKKFPNSLN